MAIEEIEIEGYLGHDPSKPSLQNYPNLVSFSVGVTQSKKNKQTDEWDSTTTWYKVNSWMESKTDYIYQTLKKGDKVVVKGRPAINLWKDKSGEAKATIVINLDKIVIPPKKDPAPQTPVRAGSSSMKDSLDDEHHDSEIPF